MDVGLAQLDVWYGCNRQNMPASRNEVIVAATLNDVRHGSAIDLQVGGNIPPEICRSQNNQARNRLSGGIAEQDSGEEDKNQRKSGDVAG